MKSARLSVTLIALLVSSPGCLLVSSFVTSRQYQYHQYHPHLQFDTALGKLTQPTKKKSDEANKPEQSDGPSFILQKRRLTRYYNWREFQPSGRGFVNKIRWLVSGDSSFVYQSDEKMSKNLASLARMLILLRQYEDNYGMPETGGLEVQKNTISEITGELYQSGAPTWAVEPVMERVAEGLNGHTGVQLSMLPRQTFIFYPSTKSAPSGTDMIKLQPGFHMSRLGAVEQVAVRLASFASNTDSVERLSNDAFRMPDADELARAEETESTRIAQSHHYNMQPRMVAKKILNLASETYGLFFFLNTPAFQEAAQSMGSKSEFWKVSDSTRELFTRLAADEASQSMKKIRDNKEELYHPLTTKMFRFFSSAGASGMWFGGSFPDMLVAGLLAVSVGSIQTHKALEFEERILTEVVASFVVGLTAGLLSIKWPGTFCFGAIAVAAVLDLMQGFKMVYAVIEVMSNRLVSGTARMFEGLLFSGLISFNLRTGLSTAFRLMNGFSSTLPTDMSPFLLSVNEIRKLWYLPLLPLAAYAWSGLFRPSHTDLPMMMFHGMLAFTLNAIGIPSFAAAMCVTFSAGIISRFTGREALGNTLAGLYALVPGVYMVRGMLTATTTSFLESVVTEAVAIGLGAWTGTILCSPTILGKSSGLHDSFGRMKRKALLYF